MTFLRVRILPSESIEAYLKYRTPTEEEKSKGFTRTESSLSTMEINPSYALDFSKGIATNHCSASHGAKGAELGASRNSCLSQSFKELKFLLQN